MPRCFRCGADSPEGARYCVACGQGLEARELEPISLSRTGIPPSPEDLAAADRLLPEAFSLSDGGRLTEAVRVAQQALSHNPNSTTAHSLLGTLYERLGNRDAAIREYQAVLSLSPGSTADRQRLNELLGLPAAPEVVGIPLPRLAKRREMPYVGIAGGFSAFIILIIIAIVALLRQSPRPGEPAGAGEPVGAASPYRAASAAAPPAPSAPTSGLPSLPSLPAPAPPPVSSSPAAAPAYASALPPEPAPEVQPLVLPFPGYRPPAEPPPRYLPGGATVMSSPPAIQTPTALSETGALGVGVHANVVAARQFVVTGRLREAKDVYEATLAAQPTPTPRLREELGSVYLRLGQPGKAAAQYLRAQSIYKQQLEQGAQGIDAEAARHGLATSQAALRALGVETPGGTP